MIISIMVYISKVGDYSKILTDDEMNDFVVINLGEYLNLWEKNIEEQNLKKVTELLYIFLATPVEVEKYVEMMQSVQIFDPK